MAKFCVHERHGGICEKTGGYCNLGACPYEDLRECDYIEPCVHGCAIIREAADKIEKLNDCTNSQCARLLEKLQKAEAAIPRWISVKDRLPEPEIQVLILADRHGIPIVTNGMYEDGRMTTEDSSWCWYEHDFEYDEEKDTYVIPEGWWEYKHYNRDDEFNHAIDDVVLYWMPLPEPPKEDVK